MRPTTHTLQTMLCAYCLLTTLGQVLIYRAVTDPRRTPTVQNADELSTICRLIADPPMVEATPEPLYTEQEILNAIRIVESGGDDNCPDGDEGRSIGPYQIGQLYWQDANSFSPAGGRYQQCRNREYAESVVRRYMQRYVPDAWRDRDAEIIARTHNGGPRGAKKTATLRYWRRVHLILSGERHIR